MSFLSSPIGKKFRGLPTIINFLELKYKYQTHSNFTSLSLLVHKLEISPYLELHELYIKGVLLFY